MSMSFQSCPVTGEMADDLAGAGMADTARMLRTLAEETRRRPAARKAAARVAMTDELLARIQLVASAYPDWSLHQIGVECGCNQGRVSEVVAGGRQ